MAYNTWGGYQTPAPQTYGQYQQQMPQQPMPPQQSQYQSIQNGGIVLDVTEEYARNYPVAAGTRVFFKDGQLPYLYAKAMGFSLMDSPVFEKFKLVKEEAEPVKETGNTAIEELSGAISELKKEINSLKSDLNRRNFQDKRKGERNE